MRLISKLLIAVLYSGQIYCQLPQPSIINNTDNTLDTLAVYNYRRLMNHSYDLINGKEYISYHLVNHSDPFYKSSLNAKGIVYYNGRTYHDLNVFYDIYKDELVLNHLSPVGYVKLIILNKHCVDSFLIRINDETTLFRTYYFPSGSIIKSGFYEVPYSGKTKLLIRHQKELVQKDGYDDYPYSIVRYLNIDGNYYPVTTLSRFVKLFGDKAPIMKKYIGSLHLVSFKRISEREIIQVLRYYETL